MKRLLLILLLLIGFISFAIWLSRYLTVGKLVVSTLKPQDTITITTTGSHPTLIKQSTGSLTISLRDGYYSVGATGNSVAAAQIVKIMAHHTLNLQLSPPAASGVEPVIDKNVYGLQSDTSRLIYADAANGELYQINSQNSISQPFGLQNFNIVRWANPDYGVGQDAKGNLYVISDGKVALLNNPGTGDSKITYAISPDKVIYVAVKQNVYKYDGQNFKQIFTASADYPQLEVATNKLAVIESADENDSSKSAGPAISIIDSVGTVTKKIGTFFASWSTDSAHLAISGTTGAEILDSSLKQVANIPQNNIANVSWIDANSLVYSINDQLWSYDLSSQKSQIMANMPLGATIARLYVNSDKSYVYISTEVSGVHHLKRVGLKGQPISNQIFLLQDILPLNLGQCSLSLVNFTRPAVFVQSSGGPSEKGCSQPVRAELQADGFDLNQLQIQFSS